MYPYGLAPSSWPFTQTRALDMAPSNSMLRYRPLAVSGSVNHRRYQPVPEIGSAPVCGLILGSNGPSIAQSWGNWTSVHSASLNPGCSAPSASPLKNRQPSLKLCRRSPETLTAVAAADAPGTKMDITNRKEKQRIMNWLLP